MPLIALTVSLLFSGFLIVRDCIRRRRSVSFAVWVPTILVMVLCSRPVSLWVSGRGAQLGIENANELSTSMIDQAFFLGVLVVSLMIAVSRKARWTRIFTSNSAIMLFYLYFAVSLLWSSDPTGSTKRLIKDFGMILPILVVFTEKAPFEAMRAVYVRCAFLLLPLSIVFIKYFPGYGRAYGRGGEMTLTGVTTQKNSLGEIVLVFTLFLFWDYLESRPRGAKFKITKLPWDLIILLLIAIDLLKISHSKSGLVCTLVGLFLLMRSRLLASRPINHAFLYFALALPPLVFFSGRFSEVITPLLKAMGRDATFTGRADIWNHVTLNTVNPFIGAGFWNFWGGPGGFSFNLAINEVIPNAHNGYVDMYLDGGFIGLAILYLMLIACGNRVTRYIRATRTLDRYQRIRFAFIIATIIYNLSESSFARIGPLWFTTLMMILDYQFRKPAVAAAAPAQIKKTALEPSAYPPVAVVHQ
jgi:exopolysaccharide production protein ExoQ